MDRFENDNDNNNKERQREDELALDVETLSSPVLSRLIEEVRQEKTGNVSAYNRTHNRHNRGR